MKSKQFQKQFNSKYGGLAKIDFKRREFEISEGTLFSILQKKIMLRKIVGKKKLPNGSYRILFSKKTYPADTITFGAWFDELNSIIVWFTALKKELKKFGYKTDY